MNANKNRTSTRAVDLIIHNSSKIKSIDNDGNEVKSWSFRPDNKANDGS